jgi:hypothetical protein
MEDLGTDGMFKKQALIPREKMELFLMNYIPCINLGKEILHIKF